MIINELFIASDFITSQINLDFVKYSTKKEIYTRLLDAKNYIDSYFYSIKSNKEIAQFCLISEYHFIRYYKQVFNITPHQYLMKKKLEKAIQLLKEDDNDINQIALKCGFSDLPSMSKAFKRQYKMSPSMYKKLYLTDGIDS